MSFIKISSQAHNSGLMKLMTNNHHYHQQPFIENTKHEFPSLLDIFVRVNKANKSDR